MRIGNERFTDTRKLLDFVYDNYSYRLVADKSKPLAEIEIKNAVKETPTLEIIIQNDIVSPAPNSLNEEDIITDISLPDEIKAPIKENQVIGTVTYRVDGLVYKTNAIAGNEVIKKPYFLYFMVILLSIILLFVLLFAYTKAHRKKRR